MGTADGIDVNRSANGNAVWIVVGVVGLLLLVCVIAGGGVGAFFFFRDQNNAPAGQGDAKKRVIGEHAGGLRDQLGDLLEAVKADDDEKAKTLGNEFQIPNYLAWLKKTYGDVDGEKAAVDYEQSYVNNGMAAFLLQDMKSHLDLNQIEIRAEPIELDRHRVKPWQQDMMNKMKAPATLYEARFAVPGHMFGVPLDSFVYVDGRFRFLGRLRSLMK